MPHPGYNAALRRSREVARNAAADRSQNGRLFNCGGQKVIAFLHFMFREDKPKLETSSSGIPQGTLLSTNKYSGGGSLLWISQVL